MVCQKKKSFREPILSDKEDRLKEEVIQMLGGAHIKIDELPSGHGYADVVFFPKKTSSMPLLLIELKWNKTEKGAIRQIKSKDYPQAINCIIKKYI